MINFKTIIRIIGILLLLETVIVSSVRACPLTTEKAICSISGKAGGITAGVGLLLAALGKGGERQLTRRDGYVLVSFAWVASSFRNAAFLYRRIHTRHCQCILRNHVRFQQYGCHHLGRHRMTSSWNTVLAQYDTVDWRLGNHHVHHCSASHLRNEWPGRCSPPRAALHMTRFIPVSVSPPNGFGVSMPA